MKNKEEFTLDKLDEYTPQELLDYGLYIYEVLESGGIEKIGIEKTEAEQFILVILKAGSSINGKLIRNAIRFSHLDILRFVSDIGFDFSEPIYYSSYYSKILHGPELPIEIAIQVGSQVVIKYLLEIGAIELDRCFMPRVAKMSPDRAIDISKLLLNAGADPNELGPDSRTALHQAAIRANIELLDLLIAHGGDIHNKDDRGYSVQDYMNM